MAWWLHQWVASMDPSLHGSSGFVRVWLPSGEELEAIPVDEVSDVTALKQRLSLACKLPRFRQRLLHEGSILEDDHHLASIVSPMGSPLEVQLVLLPFCGASIEQILQLTDSAGEGSVSEVEKVLRRPQDPNLVDSHGNTPLASASYQDHANVVRVLVEAWADPNVGHHNVGLTPLHMASFVGSEETARALLECSADTQAWGKL